MDSFKRNVYDFDHTIYRGDSTVDFFLFCLCRYPQMLVILPRFLIGALQYKLGCCSKEHMKECFYRFLRYLPDTTAEVHRFWSHNERRLQPWYIKQKHSSDLIISASPAFLLKPICSKLSVCLIASEVNMETGSVLEKNCSGMQKVLKLHEKYPDCKIRSFYSDSQSDIHLAKLAETAYLVKGNRIDPWRF